MPARYDQPPHETALSPEQSRRIITRLKEIVNRYFNDRIEFDRATENNDISHEGEQIIVTGSSRKKAVIRPLWSPALYQHYERTQDRFLARAQRYDQLGGQRPLTEDEITQQRRLHAWIDVPRKPIAQHQQEVETYRRMQMNDYRTRLNEDVIAGGDNWVAVCDGITERERNVAMLMGQAVVAITAEITQLPEARIVSLLPQIATMATTYLRQVLNQDSRYQAMRAQPNRLHESDFSTTADIAIYLPTREQVALVHYGDGRMYLVDDNNHITQLTEDHTNPDDQFISSSISLDGKMTSKGDVRLLPLATGESIIIATDGIFKAKEQAPSEQRMSFDAYLASIMRQDLPPQVLLQKLQQAAYDAQWLTGAFDDASAMLLQRPR